ncbi:MFS transporter [Actinomycetospora sp. NBRC 106375]|uniref:MFS transporter n=1 Tax=Actinomycetospora sp. NBRC 106375 TaxID=3032207 RepID=UPI002553F0D0|nr:MFS transporter [Actinomycetospora sp. NBRC 106375]
MSSPEPDPRRWHALAVCLIAGFMTLLDVSIVNVALPAMQRGIGASSAELSWVVSGYALTFGLVLVASGRLGDDRGRKKMFIISLALFTLTSAAAGFAPNAASLVVFRLLQGAAGGMLNPQVIGFIQQLFQGRERGRAFGLFGAAIGISTAIGPLLGGLLLQWGGDTDGWRWVFYVNVPIGIVALALGARLLPRDTAGDGERRPLDVVGAILLGGAVVALMVPLVLSEQDRSGAPWWLIAVAVVLLAVFIAWERRARRTHGHPLVNFALLRTRSYALGSSLGLLYFAGFTAIFFVVTLFLQNGRGYTPLEAGLALTPFALGSAVTSAVGGRLVSRLGKSLVVMGLVAVGVGLVAVDLVLRLDPAQVGWAIAGPLLLAGIGSGFVIAPNQTLALEEVPAREGGTAAGVLQTGQRVGSAIGISAVGAVFFGQLTSTGGDWALAISRGLVGAVAFVVLALVLGVTDLVLGRRRRSREAREVAPPAVAHAPAHAAGDDPDRADETVHETPDGTGLRGHVTDEAGAGVGGARLTLVDPDGREAATTATDAAGAFALVPRGAGRFQLLARADGHRPAVSWVDVPRAGRAVRDVVLPGANGTNGAARAAEPARGLPSSDAG